MIPVPVLPSRLLTSFSRFSVVPDKSFMGLLITAHRFVECMVVYNLKLIIPKHSLKIESAPNPQIFFLLNKSLHLFETYCAIWHLFQPNLDFLKAVKVTKSSHHLSHDRASKGHGSIPYLTSQTNLHCIMSL